LVKLDKIYTRGGDSGLTSLGDGKRVEKHSLRIRAYGEIDEVNSILGIVVCYCNEFLKKIILKIQNDLFDIGADLCIPSLKEKKIILNEQNIFFLEKELDKMNNKLKKLESFILPGGTKASSFLHYARTVTRRCERTIVELSSKEKINQNVIKYINRLSDLLFVAARIENIEDGDILWIPNKT
jgi:cob(I)alamin adenosyltransferase